jgi:hypothetical protein
MTGRDPFFNTRGNARSSRNSIVLLYAVFCQSNGLTEELILLPQQPLSRPGSAVQRTGALHVRHLLADGYEHHLTHDHALELVGIPLVTRGLWLQQKPSSFAMPGFRPLSVIAVRVGPLLRSTHPYFVPTLTGPKSPVPPETSTFSSQ